MGEKDTFGPTVTARDCPFMTSRYEGKVVKDLVMIVLKHYIVIKGMKLKAGSGAKKGKKGQKKGQKGQKRAKKGQSCLILFYSYTTYAYT